MVAKSSPGGHGEGAWGVGLGGGWGLGGLGIAGSNSLGEPGDEVEELPIWSRSSSRVRSDPRVRGEEEVMPEPAQETSIQVSLLPSFFLPRHRAQGIFLEKSKNFVQQNVGGK